MTSPRLGDRSPATADTPPANAGVPAAGPPNAAARPGRVSRRGLLGAAGAGLAGVAAGAAGGFALAKQDAEVAAAAPGARSYPFYGTHQAGIVTPVQDRCTSPRSTSLAARATSSSRCSRTGPLPPPG